MKLTQEIVDLIKGWEGLRLKAYKCPADVWTIGYGHTANVNPAQVITEAEAERLLWQDLARFDTGVRSLLMRHATDNQFSAMVSLAFNIGLGAFARSTALRRFNDGDLDGAAEAMRWFNKGGGRVLAGLVRRREAEAALFLRPDAPIDAPAPTPRPAPPSGFWAAIIKAIVSIFRVKT